MVRVTARHMVGGELHEHIASVRWINLATDATGQSTRAQMVEFLETDDDRAICGEGAHQVEVAW